MKKLLLSLLCLLGTAATSYLHAEDLTYSFTGKQYYDATPTSAKTYTLNGVK